MIKFSEILIHESVRIEKEHTGYLSGQDNYKFVAYVKDELAGYLSFSEYRGQPSIMYVEVLPKFKRTKVATELIRKLQKSYPNEEINLGMMTDDGAKLIKTMKRVFVPDKQYVKIEKEIEKLKKLQDKYSEEFKRGDYSNGDNWNDAHDRIYDLEKEQEDLVPGKWIFL